MKYNFEEIEEKVRKNLNPKRFAHTMRVVETAMEISRNYVIDADNLKVAALLHDYAKNYKESEFFELCKKYDIHLSEFQKSNKELIHSILGATMAKVEFGISDETVINAIENHTVGRANMTDMEMIIYVSDFCEPGRRLPEGNGVFEMAKVDLKKATYMALNSSLKYLINVNKQIDVKSIECRNWLLDSKKEV